MTRFGFLSIFFLTVFFLSSCDKNRFFEENKEIPGGIWDQNYKPEFRVAVNDTLNPYRFYINLRNAGTYPFSNVFFFIETTFPNGKKSRDTVEVMLANEKGEWLGKGSGDIWDNRILFKKGVRFPLKGEYIFTYEQAMRLEKLPSILDVGLRIEKEE